MPEKIPPNDTPSVEEDGPAPEDESPGQLREELDEALREKDQFRTMAQRAQADLVNYKKRVAEEQDELRSRAKTQLLLKVLSVVDDLERAIDHMSEGELDSDWLDGLRLVQRNLDNLLTSEGVVAIEAEGQPFDPRGHEAVYYEPKSDGPEGMVVNVIRKGYRLNDKVLRAAQVTVSKGPEPEQEEKSELPEEEA